MLQKNCCPNSDVSKGILIIRTVNLSLALHLGLLLSFQVSSTLSWAILKVIQIGDQSLFSWELQSPWKTPPSMLSSPECKATHPLSPGKVHTLDTCRLETGDFICMQSGYKLQHWIFCLCDSWWSTGAYMARQNIKPILNSHCRQVVHTWIIQREWYLFPCLLITASDNSQTWIPLRTSSLGVSWTSLRLLYFRKFLRILMETIENNWVENTHQSENRWMTETDSIQRNFLVQKKKQMHLYLEKFIWNIICSFAPFGTHLGFLAFWLRLGGPFSLFFFSPFAGCFA